MILEDVVRKELALLRSIAKRDNGKWCTQGYIKDKDWTRMQTERRLLIEMLRKAEL